MLDCSTGKIAYVVMSAGGFLGIGAGEHCSDKINVLQHLPSTYGQLDRLD